MSKLTKENLEKISQTLLQHGELEPEWRDILFPPEKQECELLYSTKQREEEIIRDAMAVPLQDVRTFGNGPKKRVGEWYNRLIFGDNLQAMKSLLSDPTVKGKVTLVYIDPPFASKQDFNGSQEQKAYQDKIAGAQFIEFLRKRLVLIRELLAPNGSIYVHLDWRKSHYIKLIMDEVFGEAKFQNEIIWFYRRWSAGSRQFQRQHDNILFYSKTSSPVFNVLYEPYTEGTLKRWKGIKRKTTIDESGKLIQVEDTNGTAGANMSDVWPISIINANAIERTDYPTQKPEALLERVITASSNENDIVLDAFVGSGTSIAVAEKLGRRWIGIDCGKLAMYTVQKRLLNLRAEIGNKGKKLNAKPFVLQNAGLYDFSTLKDLPWEDWRFFSLQLFECRDKPHRIGNLNLDGYKETASVLVYNWRTNPDELISEETISDIHAIIGKKIGKKFYIIAPMMTFEFFQDYIEKDGTRYYALRIPYNIIKELHSRDFKSVLQAREECNVNDIQEAYGFSFMISPEVEWEASARKEKGELFKRAILKTVKFKSRAWIKGEPQGGNKETLTMLMVDLDFNGKIFDLDLVFYGEELEANRWEASLPADAIGDTIMAVWIDHHGNESKAIIPRERFGIEGKQSRSSNKRRRKHEPKR